MTPGRRAACPLCAAGLAALLLLAGCAAGDPAGPDKGMGMGMGIDEPDPDLVFLAPYRNAADSCRLIGASALTAGFETEGAELVACPTGGADDAGLAAAGARRVTQTESFTLYSLPAR